MYFFKFYCLFAVYRCGVSSDMEPNYEQLSGGMAKEDPCYEALGGSNTGSDADPCYERVLHHPHLNHNGGRDLPQMSDETNDPNYERYSPTDSCISNRYTVGVHSRTLCINVGVLFFNYKKRNKYVKLMYK